MSDVSDGASRTTREATVNRSETNLGIADRSSPMGQPVFGRRRNEQSAHGVLVELGRAWRVALFIVGTTPQRAIANGWQLYLPSL
jgi:hypothetical protein